jgi:hypothetical protein
MLYEIIFTIALYSWLILAKIGNFFKRLVGRK